MNFTDFPAIIAVTNEIKFNYSSSKNIGELIKNNYELKQAIIIGEPDYIVEAFPYYIDNLIYFPRENRFGKKTNFTKKSMNEYSLDELIYTAEMLKKNYHKPVIIVIGYELSSGDPKTINLRHRKYFHYSDDALRKLYKNTSKIARFRDAMTDENYDIFLLKWFPSMVPPLLFSLPEHGTPPRLTAFNFTGSQIQQILPKKIPPT